MTDKEIFIEGLKKRTKKLSLFLGFFRTKLKSIFSLAGSPNQ